MKTRDMIKSNWISKADLESTGPIVGTIADVTVEEFSDGNKFALWFNEMEKGLLLNSTKIKLLELGFGDDTDYWRGGRVRMSFDPTVMMAGKLVGGIKIECSKASRTAQRAPGAAPAPAGLPPGARFDPLTGAPLAQPPAPAPQAPPPTWREQADARTVTPAGVPEGNPEFDDDIPF